MSRTPAEEAEYWNRLLAREGLTVDRGRFPTGKRASLKAAENEGKLLTCARCIGHHTEEEGCGYGNDHARS